MARPGIGLGSLRGIRRTCKRRFFSLELLEARLTLNGAPPPVSGAAETLTFPLSLIDGTTRQGNLPMFDPSLGTLIRAELTAEATLQGEAVVKNFSAQPAEASLRMSGQFALEVTGFNVLTTDFDTVEIPNLPLPPFDGIFDFTGPGAVEIGSDQLHSERSITSVLDTPSDLILLVGLGLLDADFTPEGSAELFEFNGNIAVQTQLEAGALVSITYTYVPFSISGNVYEDCMDTNGLFDAGETPIAGVTLVLTGQTLTGDPVGPISTVTDASGFYRFEGLRAGTYSVEQLQPEGYLDGQETRGNLTPIPGSVGTDTIGEIVIGPETPEAVQNNFGELLPSSISGFVFRDSAASDGTFDGLRSPTASDEFGGEFGIGNVLMTLTGTDDTGASVLLTTRTNPEGFYEFTGLRPGSYVVTQTHPTAETNPVPLFNYADGFESRDNSIVIEGSRATDFISVALAACSTSALNNFSETLSGAEAENCVSVSTRVHGIHSQPSTIVLTFGASLDPARAQNTSNYQISQAGKDKRFGTADDKVIPVGSAVYDAALGTVTLRPTKRLSLGKEFRLFVKGPDGLFSLDSNTGIEDEFGNCGDLETFITRGTHLDYRDRDGDRVSLGVSRGGVLELHRAPDGEARRLYIVDGSAGGPKLKARKSFVQGSVKKRNGGDGRAAIGQILQAVPIGIRLKPSKFTIGEVRVPSPPLLPAGQA
jgi:hypothetical protein